MSVCVSWSTEHGCTRCRNRRECGDQGLSPFESATALEMNDLVDAGILAESYRREFHAIARAVDFAGTADGKGRLTLEEEPTQEINPEERARRQKRNRRRKLDRQKVAEGRALPPVVGLGRSQYLAMFGADADYDAYADAFIAGAKKARRRWEFPLDPLAGASFHSLKRHGMPIEGG